MILDELKNFYGEIKLRMINELNLVAVMVRLLSLSCENNSPLSKRETALILQMVEPLFVNDYVKYVEDKDKETFLEESAFNISSQDVLKSFFIQDGFNILNQFYDDNPRKFEEDDLLEVKALVDVFGEMTRVQMTDDQVNLNQPN